MQFSKPLIILFSIIWLTAITSDAATEGKKYQHSPVYYDWEVFNERWYDWLKKRPEGEYVEKLRVKSRLNFYSNEAEGTLFAIIPNKELNDSANIEFEVSDISKIGILRKTVVREGLLVEQSFDISEFELGEKMVRYCLSVNGNELSKGEITIRKEAFVDGETKIDQLTNRFVRGSKAFRMDGYFLNNLADLTGSSKLEDASSNIASYLRYLGIEVVLTGIPSLEILDFYHKHDIKVMVNVGIGTEFFKWHKFDKNSELAKTIKKNLSNKINLYKDHPAVVAWYASDEPVGGQRNTEFLNWYVDIIRTLDRNHPVGNLYMSVTPIYDMKLSESFMDFVLIDTYHIPGSVRQNYRDVVALKNGLDMPAILVPQMFGGGEWWSREPSSKEAFAVQFLQLIAGSAGSLPFRYARASFPLDPMMHHKICESFRIFENLNGFLASQERAPKVSLKYDKITAPQPFDKNRKRESRNRNFIYQNNLDKKIRLYHQVYQYKGSTTIILVNPEIVPVPVEVSISKDDLEPKGFSRLEGYRAIELKKSLFKGAKSFNDTIEPYGVKIYQFRTKDWAIQSNNLDEPHVDNQHDNPSFEYIMDTKVAGAGYRHDRNMQNHFPYIDSTEAVHGYNCYAVPLKEGAVAGLGFNEIHSDDGDLDLTISIWAKADSEQPNAEYPKISLNSGLGESVAEGYSLSKTFKLTSEWKKYNFKTKLAKDFSNVEYGYGRFTPSISITAGNSDSLVKVDLMQSVIKNETERPSHWKAYNERWNYLNKKQNEQIENSLIRVPHNQ